MRPLFLVSDSITSPTGLGRITRELAIRIHEDLSDVYRLGVAGFGGTYSRKFPFPQYPFKDATISELPAIWNDFAGDERGVVLFIWNASWLPWMADPDTLPECDLKKFLKSNPFEKWIYVPIDSHGPNDRLHESEKKILGGFDRVLAYTKWGGGVIDRTFHHPASVHPEAPVTDFLPHGTDRSIFFPRDRGEARRTFLDRVVKKAMGRLSDDFVLIGVCATNTPRKDWGLAFQVCGELLKRKVNVGVWAHTDRFGRPGNWDLPGLAEAFGLKHRVMFTNGNLSDEDMSWGYAAMNVTLGIGSGEGWGLPISESLACGVPCITGDYAGATDFTPPSLRVKPVEFRLDGCFSNYRPVFNPADWADKVIETLEVKRGASLLPEEFFWDKCWPRWKEWLRLGAK